MILFLGSPGCESSALKLFRPLSQSALSQSCLDAKVSEQFSEQLMLRKVGWVKPGDKTDCIRYMGKLQLRRFEANAFASPKDGCQTDCVGWRSLPTWPCQHLKRRCIFRVLRNTLVCANTPL